MAKWQEVKLGEICKFQNGKKRPLVKGTYPVYGGNGILDYTNQFNLERGVIIGRVGAYCGSVFISKEKCWISDNAISGTSTYETDIFYIYYLLKSLNLNARHIGSGQPLITQDILNNILIPLPPLETQKKIAGVLSALDDKIELNNKINQNLEQQAQALFKSWFIDFAPFGGTMPADWKVGNLLDIAEYLNGLAMQKFRPTEGEKGIPVLKIKELRQGFCDSNSEFCTPKVKRDYIISDGDVIFSWSGSLLVDFWCGGECGLNQHLFKVFSKKFDKWFYYAWTKHHLDRFVAIAADKATTMGHIKRDELEKAEVIIPKSEDYFKIGKILAPTYDLIIQNRIENTRLAQLRDTLLPKLMSGELDVSQVDISKEIVDNAINL